MPNLTSDLAAVVRKLAKENAQMARCLAHQSGMNCFCDECEATYALPVVDEAYEAWENARNDGEADA